VFVLLHAIEILDIVCPPFSCWVGTRSMYKYFYILKLTLYRYAMNTGRSRKRILQDRSLRFVDSTVYQHSRWLRYFVMWQVTQKKLWSWIVTLIVVSTASFWFWSKPSTSSCNHAPNCALKVAYMDMYLRHVVGPAIVFIQ
jgi:hypothetical protein